MNLFIKFLTVILLFSSCRAKYIERGEAGNTSFYLSSKTTNKQSSNKKKSLEIDEFCHQLEIPKVSKKIENQNIEIITPSINLNFDLIEEVNTAEKSYNKHALNKPKSNREAHLKIPLENYKGKNKAMKYGLQLLVYGAFVLGLILIPDALMLWEYVPTVILVLMLLFVATPAILAIIIGFLLFFFGWIASLFQK